MMMRNRSLGKVVFCIENELFRSYLKSTLRPDDEFFIDYREFALKVAEDPQGILVLQSDSHEYDQDLSS